MTHLCVSLTEQTTDELLKAMHALPSQVGMVEVRIDCMRSFDLQRICAGRDRRIIVTNRPRRESGGWRGEEAQRLDVLRRAAELGADYVDVELDATSGLRSLPAGVGRIVSYHNFEETPSDLEGVLQALLKLRPDVAKVAVRAGDVTDSARVLDLLRRHSEHIPLIALAMGEEGIPTRLLASKYGAFLSFASAGQGAEAAPGQVPWQHMLQLYRFPRIDAATAVYGVVADPVAHSMSPAIHNAAFEATELNAVYLPFRVKDPASFLDAWERHDLRGLSVTIPHKESMLELMDDVDPLAAGIGAVNTVQIAGGRRLGSNTDVAAAVAAIEDAARRAGLWPMDQQTVLIVGAGGAARAIAYGLNERVARLVIANRTASRAEKLAAEFDAEACGLDEMEKVRPDVLVNSTSVGMWPNVDDSPVPRRMLRKGMVVFDAVYNPIETKLLRQAAQAGTMTASGMEWFVNQAVAQFELWTGQAAPREVMERVVRQRLREHG